MQQLATVHCVNTSHHCSGIHRHSRSGGPRLSRSRRRGAALLLTVLIAAAAATITLVVTSQALSSARTQGSRQDRQEATTLLNDAQQSFQQQLQSSPWFFLTRTFADEQDRNCVTGATSTPVGPGQSWPAACGTTWTYTNNPTPGPVVAEITPPSVTSPYLTLELVAKSGTAELGRSVKYLLDGSGLFSVWAEHNLDLNHLVQGAGTTKLGGPIYSGGTITLPASSSVVLSDAQLSAEQGFTTSPTNTSLQYFAGTAVPSTSASVPSIGNIRSVVPAPLTTQDLAAQVAEDRAVACGATAASLSNGLSSELCLVSNTKLVNQGGTSVSTPTTPGAYLLLFGTGGTTTVQVYYHASGVAVPEQCLIRCDSTALASGEVAANATPGTIGYWTSLGVFNLPASGVIATDAPTYVGLCGSAFTTAGTACTDVSGSQAGMQIATPVTVVAGTPSSPEDVYLSGPILSSGSSRLGIVATGDILIPTFAQAPGTSLTVDAGLIALGLGQPNQQRSAIKQIAAGSVAPTPAGPSTAAALTINGAVVAPELDLADLSNYANVSVLSDPAFVRDPPPYWPGFGGSWEELQSTQLSAGQVSSVGNPG